MPDPLNYKIKIADVFVLLMVLLFSGITFHYLPKHEIGKKCLLYVAGKKYARLDLSGNIVVQDTVNTGSGIIVVEFGNKRIRILKSTCPNKICIKQGWISESGQTIACVPNRFLVVIPQESGTLDAITE